MNTHDLTSLNASVEWHHDEGPIEEQRLALQRASRLPSRPVDVFRDLGMTEEAIASYLWRWRCAGLQDA